MIRRAVDIAVSSLALLASAPVLALAALAIRVESPGAVIYSQRRAGVDGRTFDVLKLRTMVDGAEHIGARPGGRCERPAHHARRRVPAQDLPG